MKTIQVFVRSDFYNVNFYELAKTFYFGKHLTLNIKCLNLFSEKHLERTYKKYEKFRNFAHNLLSPNFTIVLSLRTSILLYNILN